MVFHPRQPSPPRGAGQAAPPGTERVARALARAGVSSRRDAERLIEDGRVAMNGEVLTSPAVNVGPDDIITLDGKPIAEPEAVRVWRYHKPTGLLTTHKDPRGRATVFDSLPKEMGRVISVGRLDLNSEGVLLLTNDGALARALELPANGWLRRYRARAFGRVSQDRLNALKSGVTIEGVAYGPIEAVMEKSGGGSNIWINVAISEGKNREVRRVLEHLGLKVNRLIRVAYGPFELGDLEPGAVAEVPPRVIREKLAAAIPPERMPKGDRRMFNWAPGRDERRSFGQTARRPDRISSSDENEAREDEPGQRRPPRAPASARNGAGRAPSHGRNEPSTTAAESRRREPSERVAPTESSGWVRKTPLQAEDGERAKPAAVAHRRTSKSDSAPQAKRGPARAFSGKPLARGDLVEKPRHSGAKRPGAAGDEAKAKPVYKAGWAKPKSKAPAKRAPPDGAGPKSPRRPKR